MRIKNVAIFLYQEETFWISCKKINRNLVETARLAYPDARLKIFALDSSFFGNYKLVDEIIEFDPCLLYFFDHRLFPELALLPLLEAGFSLKSRLLKIHLFGNFIFRGESLTKLFTMIEGAKVQYNFSSNRMKSLFAKMFSENFTQALAVTPLPVSEDYIFNIDKSLNNKIHKRDIKRLFYTGRISGEKNCHLILEVAKELRKQREDFELVFAGGFDDYSLFGKKAPDGHYMAFFSQKLREIDPEQKFIRYLPNLEEKELIGLLWQSDLFISLSTMAGEDFGMSLAEAAVSGAKCFATDWGGFSEIAKRSGQVCLAPVKYTPERFEIQLDKTLEEISKALDNTPCSLQKREIRSRRAYQNFSIETVAQIIKRQELFLAQEKLNGRGVAMV